MKELSKEDKERIENQKAEHINFAVAEILDRVLPAQGIGTPREGLRMFAFNQIYTLIDHYRNKSRTEGFNDGIEAVKMLFNPMFEIHPDSKNIVAIIESMRKAFESIDKLKK